jgi:hypothetical protein
MHRCYQEHSKHTQGFSAAHRFAPPLEITSDHVIVMLLSSLGNLSSRPLAIHLTYTALPSPLVLLERARLPHHRIVVQKIVPISSSVKGRGRATLTLQFPPLVSAMAFA